MLGEKIICYRVLSLAHFRLAYHALLVLILTKAFYLCEMMPPIQFWRIISDPINPTYHFVRICEIFFVPLALVSCHLFFKGSRSLAWQSQITQPPALLWFKPRAAADTERHWESLDTERAVRAACEPERAREEKLPEFLSFKRERGPWCGPMRVRSCEAPFMQWKDSIYINWIAHCKPIKKPA